MNKKFRKLFLSCAMTLTLACTCVMTQAEEAVGKELTDAQSISACAANVKSIYKAKYPDQAEIIDDIVNILSNSDEFISIFEKEGASAFCIIEDSLRDVLEPAAAPCGYTPDWYFSDYANPLIKQVDGESCGPASTLMALIGSGAPEYNYTNDKATLDDWQRKLKNEYLHTTTEGTEIRYITEFLQNNVPSRDGYKFKSKAFTRYSYNLALDFIADSLINDAVPVIQVHDTSVLGYYNGYRCGHYVVVVSINTLEREITLADPNKNDAYFGYHVISFEEFNYLAETLAYTDHNFWISTYTNAESDLPYIYN